MNEQVDVDPEVVKKILWAVILHEKNNERTKAKSGPGMIEEHIRTVRSIVDANQED